MTDNLNDMCFNICQTGLCLNDSPKYVSILFQKNECMDDYDASQGNYSTKNNQFVWEMNFQNGPYGFDLTFLLLLFIR